MIYFILLITCIVDYLRDYKFFEIIWYFLFVISFVSLFIWDVIVDWGLL